MPYAELLTRARLQAGAATEAFYVSRWDDLEDNANGLQQTARFLTKSVEIPAAHKEKLAEQAAALAKDARKLSEAAKAHEVKLTNDMLQSINLRVRELRLEK
jgi:hypothetical protein